MTYTYTLLDVSASTYDEVAKKLRAAGYDQAFQEDGAIDMHGIALVCLSKTPLKGPAPKKADEVKAAPGSEWHGDWETIAVQYLYRRRDGIEVKFVFGGEKPWTAYYDRGRGRKWLAGKAKSCRTFKTAEAAMKAVDKTWPLAKKKGS